MHRRIPIVKSSSARLYHYQIILLMENILALTTRLFVCIDDLVEFKGDTHQLGIVRECHAPWW